MSQIVKTFLDGAWLLFRYHKKVLGGFDDSRTRGIIAMWFDALTKSIAMVMIRIT